MDGLGISADTCRLVGVGRVGRALLSNGARGLLIATKGDGATGGTRFGGGTYGLTIQRGRPERA